MFLQFAFEWFYLCELLFFPFVFIPPTRFSLVLFFDFFFFKPVPVASSASFARSKLRWFIFSSFHFDSLASDSDLFVHRRPNPVRVHISLISVVYQRQQIMRLLLTYEKISFACMCAYVWVRIVANELENKLQFGPRLNLKWSSSVGVASAARNAWMSFYANNIVNNNKINVFPATKKISSWSNLIFRRTLHFVCFRRATGHWILVADVRSRKPIGVYEW